MYDHAGRTDNIVQKVGPSGVERVLAANDYDETGALKTKNIGGLEMKTFDYNVRGWVRGVNRSYLTATSSTTKFGYELGYDNTTAIVSAANYGTAQYNGNIAGMLRRSAGDGEKRKI